VGLCTKAARKVRRATQSTFLLQKPVAPTENVEMAARAIDTEQSTYDARFGTEGRCVG